MLPGCITPQQANLHFTVQCVSTFMCSLQSVGRLMVEWYLVQISLMLYSVAAEWYLVKADTVVTDRGYSERKSQLRRGLSELTALSNSW